MKRTVSVFALLIALMALVVIAGCGNQKSSSSTTTTATSSADKSKTATTAADKEKLYGDYGNVIVVRLETGQEFSAVGRAETDEPMTYTGDLDDHQTRCTPESYAKIRDIDGLQFEVGSYAAFCYLDGPDKSTRFTMARVKAVTENTLQLVSDVGTGVDISSPNRAALLRASLRNYTDESHQGSSQDRGLQVYSSDLKSAARYLFNKDEFGVVLEDASAGDLAYVRCQKFPGGKMPLYKWPTKIRLADGTTIYCFCTRDDGKITYLGEGYKTPAWKGVVSFIKGNDPLKLKMKLAGFCPADETYYNKFYTGKPIYFNPKTGEKI